ncbi:uncharacterized protein LOC129589873 [Paramacrobiotus metropolitanus]|uniref:uncharacterized protein LOC129589873 n=1 Tax=Paramacrobiotus metropolitanus TaxID=2943436 RepID=UPI002445E524|nr:uncharacterized protein LOC129589873 [Paramacrobiotus metropolitanus]
MEKNLWMKVLSVQPIFCLVIALASFAAADEPVARVRRSYYNNYNYKNYTKTSSKTCPTCAACAPPCPASTPAPPPSTCTDNPCYFNSLPYACSAEQCADFIKSAGDKADLGRAVIVNLPEEVCITTCQLQQYGTATTDSAFLLYRYGACTKTGDLSPVVRDNLNTGTAPSDNVVSSLNCGTETCLAAYVDTIYVKSNCATQTYTADTTLQCTLQLKKGTDLLATSDLTVKVQYVNPADCGIPTA